MLVSEIELFEALSEQIGKEKAKILVQYVEGKIEKNIDQKKDTFSTKQDLADLEVRLNRTIYIVGLGQFLAILASIIGLIKFLR
jgi:hypothetical protein